jgi:hypothetical protein
VIVDKPELIKQLVEFGKCPTIDLHSRPFELFKNYDQELLVQICYNVNLSLDSTYDTNRFQRVYQTRSEAIKILEKWLKSDETTRLSMRHELACIWSSCSTAHVNLRVADMNPDAARWAVLSIIEAISAAEYNNSFIEASRSVSYSYSNTNAIQIIIKTVCEYYKMDYETFKALYL